MERRSTIQLARDRIFSFDLQSNLIKNLHCRFRENDITISYPVRTLQFSDGWGPEMLAGQASATPLTARPASPVTIPPGAPQVHDEDSTYVEKKRAPTSAATHPAEKGPWEPPTGQTGRSSGSGGAVLTNLLEAVRLSGTLLW